MMSSIAVETSPPDSRWRNFQQQAPWTHQHHVQRQIHHQKLNSSGEEASECSETQEPSPPSSVDSSEKTPEEKMQSEAETWEHFSQAQPTFLGTTVWEKRIPFDGQDFKLEYVDLEDFLAENSNAIPVTHPDNAFGISKLICNPSESNSTSNLEPPPQPFTIDHQFNIGISKALVPPHSSPHLSSHLNHSSSRSSSPSDSSASTTSRDVSPDATQPQPPVLAVAPGHEFDPSSRVFSQAELKPQPIVKKSRKQFVPNEQKDAKYWVRRRKNNMAAKRSRDARRVKENQIAMRACFLESENHMLKEEIERVQKENHLLKEEISRCHAEHH